MKFKGRCRGWGHRPCFSRRSRFKSGSGEWLSQQGFLDFSQFLQTNDGALILYVLCLVYKLKFKGIIFTWLQPLAFHFPSISLFTNSISSLDYWWKDGLVVNKHLHIQISSSSSSSYNHVFCLEDRSNSSCKASSSYSAIWCCLFQFPENYLFLHVFQ